MIAKSLAIFYKYAKKEKNLHTRAGLHIYLYIHRYIWMSTCCNNQEFDGPKVGNI